MVETFHAIFIILLSLFFFVGLFRGARTSLWFWPGFPGMAIWLYMAFDINSFANLFSTNSFFAILGVFFMAYALIGTLVGYARNRNSRLIRSRIDNDDDDDLRRLLQDRRTQNQQQFDNLRRRIQGNRAGPPQSLRSAARSRVWEEIERMRPRQTNDERDSWRDLI